MAGRSVPLVISLAAYARHRGVSKEAVSRAVKKGRLAKCIERNERGQPKIRSVEEADAEWAETTRPQPAVSVQSGDTIDGGPFSYAEESAREKHWKANLAQLEFETKAGDMVPAAEASEVVVERFAEVKTKLSALAHQCKQLIPRLTLAEIEIIEDLVAEALEAIADEGEENGE